MKLYWRYKKDGKWTWKAVGADFELDELAFVGVHPPKEEEE